MSHVKSVVSGFIENVRSGRSPRSAAVYMADEVVAHQIISGNESEIIRTPSQYAEHIEEFLTCFGEFQLHLEEMLVDNDKVYVRWRQVGVHKSPIWDFQATNLPLVTFGSAVYRVADGKICEYWIQQENQGLLTQLKSNAETWHNISL